jgi:hypothetical protein
LHELGLVLLVVLLELRVLNGRVGRDHLALEPVGDELEGDPVARLLLGVAGLVEEALEGLLGAELLLLRSLELLVDLPLGHLDALLIGLAANPGGEDQI